MSASCREIRAGVAGVDSPAIHYLRVILFNLLVVLVEFLSWGSTFFEHPLTHNIFNHERKN